MTQRITWTVADMVAAANDKIEAISPAEAVRRQRAGEAHLVDVRDVRELNRDGRIPGAFHAPRGMLEFWIDPASPYHKPIFGEDKAFIFLCAAGLRSVLSAKTAQDMGLAPIAHVEGGFRSWAESGEPVDLPDDGAARR